jgi:YrbI family 3-deoxy-D-manno-octulosonate 8-phosphate phosphatase
VFTENGVWVAEDGHELVRCSRFDGMGITLLKRQPSPPAPEIRVLSTEENPVVSARCRKLGIPCSQGIGRKGEAMDTLIAERQLSRDQVAFVGNDVNDLPAFARCGLRIAVADAHPLVAAEANWTTQAIGGHGAVREVCDAFLSALGWSPQT